MNIIELVSQYFTITHKNGNNYQIVSQDGKYDSIVIFGDTNSWFRFSNRQGGGPKEFLKYIVGLDDEEIDLDYGDIVYNLFIPEVNKYQTEFSYKDVVGTPGYNSYIQSRNVSRETAEKFGLELSIEGHVYIPLYEDGLRTGSLVRRNDTNEKHLKYRFHMINGYKRPEFVYQDQLRKLKRNSHIIIGEGIWYIMLFNQWCQHLEHMIPLSTIGTNPTDLLFNSIYEFPITFIKDDDEGGEHVDKIVNKWREKGLNVNIVTPKDNQGKSLYVDELSQKQFVRLFETISNQRVDKFGFRL